MSQQGIWRSRDGPPTLMQMLYALVANDCTFAVDLFTKQHDAERALAEALADEPAWVELLSVVAVAARDDWGRWN